MQAPITLVSRRWRRVFFSEPALREGLELTARSLGKAESEGKAQQWFATQASLLRRIGGFVQHLGYSQRFTTTDYATVSWDDPLIDMQQLAAASGMEWQLGSVLAHLNPASLRSLYLEWTSVDAAAAAALERLSGLTGLLFECRDDVPAPLLAALPSLSQLQWLEFRYGNMPEGLSTALQHLTQLSCLICTSDNTLPELTALLPLTRLRTLEWEEQREASLLQADLRQLLARLPQLESCHIESHDSTTLEASIQVCISWAACYVWGQVGGLCACTT